MQAIRRLGAGRAALAVAAFLLLIVSAAAFAGYRAGLTQNASASATETAAEIDRQYELGIEDLAAGRLLIAGERFRYVLSLDPAHAGAAQQLAEVEARLSQTVAAPTLEPTATRPAVDPHAQPAELLAQAEAALDQGDWDAAIAILAEIHRSHPDFETERVRAALGRAYQERGVARIKEYRLQEGILDLDHAETYGELSEAAEAHRVWATLYVRGNGLWGADWPAAIAIFEDLHRAAPYFHDTIAKLHGAYVGYGDQLQAGGDLCGAAQQYALAGGVVADAAVDEARRAAEEACARLTPTPGPGTPSATPQATPAETPTP
jgi:tetratricopeptide (TPR) repeat protein